jgi:hypothetical protein
VRLILAAAAGFLGAHDVTVGGLQRRLLQAQSSSTAETQA